MSPSLARGLVAARVWPGWWRLPPGVGAPLSEGRVAELQGHRRPHAETLAGERRVWELSRSVCRVAMLGHSGRGGSHALLRKPCITFGCRTPRTHV